MFGGLLILIRPFLVSRIWLANMARLAMFTASHAVSSHFLVKTPLTSSSPPFSFAISSYFCFFFLLSSFSIFLIQPYRLRYGWCVGVGRLICNPGQQTCSSSSPGCFWRWSLVSRWIVCHCCVKSLSRYNSIWPNQQTKTRHHQNQLTGIMTTFLYFGLHYIYN